MSTHTHGVQPVLDFARVFTSECPRQPSLPVAFAFQLALLIPAIFERKLPKRGVDPLDPSPLIDNRNLARQRIQNRLQNALRFAQCLRAQTGLELSLAGT